MSCSSEFGVYYPGMFISLRQDVQYWGRLQKLVRVLSLLLHEEHLSRAQLFPLQTECKFKWIWFWSHATTKDYVDIDQTTYSKKREYSVIGTIFLRACIASRIIFWWLAIPGQHSYCLALRDCLSKLFNPFQCDIASNWVCVFLSIFINCRILL